MRRLGVRTRLRLALAKVDKEISNVHSRGGKYAAGLAREGYAGGYAQALMDMQLVLNGVQPNTRNYWEVEK